MCYFSQHWNILETLKMQNWKAKDQIAYGSYLYPTVVPSLSSLAVTVALICWVIKCYRDISDGLLSSTSSSSGSRQLLRAGVEGRRKMPVFESEEDRLLFDRCLEMDIAPLVRGMYSSRVIQQSATEHSASGSASATTVHMLTCNSCSKVFSSLSHCQLHCLTHSTARPYQCPWCSYSTNIRGTPTLHSAT